MVDKVASGSGTSRLLKNRCSGKAIQASEKGTAMVRQRSVKLPS